MHVDLTHFIAEEAHQRQYENLPDSVLAMTRQCLLDCTGTAIAGASEDFVQGLRAELSEQGGKAEAHVFGGGTQALPALSAALINGTSAHALDYDDVNFHMAAHPSVAIFPALLALAERRGASWREVAQSFVAGYEAGCRVGRYVEPSHYRMGFHGTATIGTFAAAVACARLLDLSVPQIVAALGIAATQAAGIRAMFGTACKPLHAGKAAHNGLFAALLAARDFSTHPQALTTQAGFAVTHSEGADLDGALAVPANGGYFLHDNLFKYHAACYLTHAVADALATLRDHHQITPEQVAELQVTAAPDLDTVCSIADPQDGLQLKFSVAGVAALTMARIDTGKLSTFSTERAQDATFRELLPRVRIHYEAGREKTLADVTVRLQDGRRWSASSDSGVPMADLQLQEQKLLGKFEGLATDALSQARAQALLAQYRDLDAASPMRHWMQAAAG